MPNPVTLSELRALREKATQGSIDLMDGDSFNFAVQAIVGQGEDKLAEFFHYQVAEYIVALWNFFDRPSTQAMLEAGERVAAAFPEHAVTGIASALREYARERQTMNGTWDLRSQRLVDWAILIEAGKATAESNARDAERLDWLLHVMKARNVQTIYYERTHEIDGPTCVLQDRETCHVLGYGSTARAAIDAARWQTITPDPEIAAIRKAGL